LSARRFFSFFWILFIFLAQNTLNFWMPGALPPLTLPAALYIGLMEGPAFGFVIGLFAGLLNDIIVSQTVGALSLTWAALCAFAGASASTIFRESFFSWVLLPVLAMYVHMVCMAITLQSISFFSALVRAFSVGTLFLTAVCSPILFAMMRRIAYRRVYARRS